MMKSNKNALYVVGAIIIMALVVIGVTATAIASHDDSKLYSLLASAVLPTVASFIALGRVNSVSNDVNTMANDVSTVKSQTNGVLNTLSDQVITNSNQLETNRQLAAAAKSVVDTLTVEATPNAVPVLTTVPALIKAATIMPPTTTPTDTTPTASASPGQGTPTTGGVTP